MDSPAGASVLPRRLRKVTNISIPIMASNRATVTEDESSSSSSFSSMSGDEDEVRYFSPVIRGVGKDFNFHLIQIPCRRNVSFGDIRGELVKDGFNDILKGKGLDIDSLRFHLSATGRFQLNSTQEQNYREWNVWEYAYRTGDGSVRNPYLVFMGSAGNKDSQKSKSRSSKEETSSSSSFSSMSRDKNEKRYFSTVIRGEGKVFNLIEIPYRQNISFADIRDKLVEDCFTRFLGVDVDSLRFYLSADAPCQLDLKQEPDWKTWNVWEYAKGTGDGSFRNPYLVFME